MVLNPYWLNKILSTVLYLILLIIMSVWILSLLSFISVCGSRHSIESHNVENANISVFKPKLEKGTASSASLQFWHNVDKNLQEGHRCVDAVPKTGNVVDVMP
jgi:hypothetical protein